LGIVIDMANAPRKRRPKRKPYLEFTSTVPWIDTRKTEEDPILRGYVRVSTDTQDTQRQVDELVMAGVNPVDIQGDMASGSTMERPGWEMVLKKLEAGDILVVHSLERMSRNTLDTLQAFRDLSERGIKIKVLNMDLDTTTPIGRFAMTIFAAFGQLERDMAVDRIRSGMERARERGVQFGHARRFPDTAVKAAYEAAGTIEGAAKKLGCSQMTIMRGLTRQGISAQEIYKQERADAKAARQAARAAKESENEH
jgi:DNA invertase Pin-like site-specific DNA recombinase